MGTKVFYRKWIPGLLLAAVAYSCDVHEFPKVEPEQAGFTLHLEFETDLPLHQVVDHTTRAEDPSMQCDIRYTINAYCCDQNMNYDREADYTFVVTKDEVSDPDHDVELKLDAGVYHFIVWADYVDDGSTEDKYYDTGNFEEICLQGEHCGCTELRDAFYGTVDAEVGANAAEAHITMQRPLARYNFVSNDLGEFITRVLEMRAQNAALKGGDPALADEGTRTVNLDDFKVVFRYAGFMPSAFNPFTGKRCDAATGVSFESKLTKIDDTDVELGFDYVFVNGSESKVPVAVEIYDKDGTLLSSTDAVEVPIVRSKHTTVRGKFLTSEASGNVGIDPGFDGDWNYEIK